MDFFPMDRDLGWGIEPEFHSVISHRQYRNGDAIADDEFFPQLATEKQHLYSLLATEFFDSAGYGIVPRS